MSDSVTSLLDASYVVSTSVGVGGGAGAVWAVVKVYLKFIMRDLERLELRLERVERRRATDYREGSSAD